MQQKKWYYGSVLLYRTVFIGLTITFFSCSTPQPTPKTADFQHVRANNVNIGNLPPLSNLVILDFEVPNPKVILSADGAPSTPSTAPAPAAAAPPFSPSFTRSAYQPHGGLWCLRAPVRGGQQWRHPLDHPTDLRLYDTFWTYVMHDSAKASSGLLHARAFLEDAAGHHFESDAYPILAHWQGVPLDLLEAGQNGLALDQITAVGLHIEPAVRHERAAAPTINVQTDDWVCTSGLHTYAGQRLGAPGTFYVQRQGSRVAVGVVHKFEMVFHERAGVARPWLEIFQGPTNKCVLGQPGTGLMLLGQDQFDGLAPGLHQTAQDGHDRSAPAGTPPAQSWPGSQAHWVPQCVWSDPAGAIIEVQQTVGPFDRLGRPATELTWRFMIYPTGQVFVHAAWRHETDFLPPVPVTWALGVDRTTLAAPADVPERLLKDIYAEAARRDILPHQVQVGAPVHLAAKVGGESNLYWWADAGRCRYFGVGLPERHRAGPLDCLLLVREAGLLEVAGCFSQYITGPALRMKTGVQDMNFPGDLDNDGVVEPYGFQAIRLANGRAVFDLDPQGRPLYYPIFLISNPIGSPSLETSRILVNIDGQQLADPPHWPDGSYLLQLPWVITKPVHLEISAVPR